MVKHECDCGNTALYFVLSYDSNDSGAKQFQGRLCENCLIALIRTEPRTLIINQIGD